MVVKEPLSKEKKESRQERCCDFGHMHLDKVWYFSNKGVCHVVNCLRLAVGEREGTGVHEEHEKYPSHLRKP